MKLRLRGEYVILSIIYLKKCFFSIFLCSIGIDTSTTISTTLVSSPVPLVEVEVKADIINIKFNAQKGTLRQQRE